MLFVCWLENYFISKSINYLKLQTIDCYSVGSFNVNVHYVLYVSETETNTNKSKCCVHAQCAKGMCKEIENRMIGVKIGNRDQCFISVRICNTGVFTECSTAWHSIPVKLLHEDFALSKLLAELYYAPVSNVFTRDSCGCVLW